MRKSPNRVTHFDDVSVIALERRDGTVLPCYIDTKDYDLVKGYRWSVDSPSQAKTSYVATRTGGYRLRMHQLLMPLTDGRTPDHVDRIGLNNRRGNLRPATPSQQIQNRSCKKTYCIRGHERTQENVTKNGQCRACKTLSNAARCRKRAA